HSSHSRYQWRTSNETFIQAHREALLSADSLTAKKLERLLERYSGTLSNLPVLTTGEPANRLNFSALERLDVLTGLLDFAGISDAHAEHLQSVYAEGALQPFGPVLELDAVRRERAAILGQLGLQ